MHRSTRAVALGAILALALAAPVAAANVSETLVVNGTITVTGLPASLDYGALDAGTSSAEKVMNYSVSANGAFVIAITGTDFARTGGGATIPNSARSAWLTTPTSGANCTPTEIWTSFGASLACTGAADGAKAYTLKTKVAVPGGQMAGSYTGTITVAISIP